MDSDLHEIAETFRDICPNENNNENYDNPLVSFRDSNHYNQDYCKDYNQDINPGQNPEKFKGNDVKRSLYTYYNQIDMNKKMNE